MALQQIFEARLKKTTSALALVSLASLCRLKGNTTIAHMAVGVTSLKEFLVQNVFEDWTTMISKENWGFFPDQTAA